MRILKLRYILVSFACIAGFVAAPLAVHATQQEKVLLCHKTEGKNNYVIQSVNANEVKSHEANGDFPYLGNLEEKDVNWCCQHAPAPPVYACTLGVTAKGDVVTATITPTGNQTLTGTEFNWGDKSTPDASTSLTGTHTYKDGDYVITATVSFGDLSTTCKASITVTTNNVIVNHTIIEHETTPVPVPESVPLK